jgi:AcrR family transcriptional regulator
MKVKTFILIALVAMFTACTPSLESLVTQFEKAAEDGDVAKAEKIIDKIDKHYTEDDLTIDQAERLAAASFQLILNGGTELFESASEEALDAMDDAMDEAADALDDAVDEAVDALDEALEDLEW